ncbi:organic solvent tolerance protein OstA [Novipirellula aureliae]|nr:organic solvent tolerance protein OstA [Novipirellula aureliae]
MTRKTPNWPRLAATVAPRFRRVFTTFLLLFVLGSVADGQQQPSVVSPDVVSPDPVRVSGDVIYRWQIGSADASLLEGDCILEHRGERLNAASILLLVSGDIGRVSTEVIVDGVRLADGSVSQPRRLNFVTLADPEIQAPLYRGKPDHPPLLLKYLKPKRLGATSVFTPTSGYGAVRPVQFSAPPLEAPPFEAPPFEAPPFEARPFEGTPFDEMDLDASTYQPIQTPKQQVLDPPTQNRPLTPEIIPPSEKRMLDEGMIGDLPSPVVSSASPPDSLGEFSAPPITLSDGATTGGFQFFVGGGSRSVEVLKRDSLMPPQIETSNRPETGETVVVARGGVTMLVRDVSAQMPGGDVMQLGTISLSADRIVAWLPLVTNMFNGTTSFDQADGEIYLEGNIVFRQGERVIYAESMYYNVARETGVVLDAETIATVPNYQGIVRLKADMMQQIGRGNFVAFDAAMTTSRMGVPRYWLQSERLQLTDRNGTVTDPITGVTSIRKDPFVSSRDNFVYFGGVPILYWPTFSTSLRDPTLYVSDVAFGNDSIFGTQLLLDFNLLQILGIDDPPSGVKWELSTDYLSKRGPAIGTLLSYQVPGMFGAPGNTSGLLDAWVIDDKGTDTLGPNRKNLQPEVTTRGQVLFRHRQQTAGGYEFIAEFGWLSDRNFLDQYFENEWDQDKNRDTDLRLRRYVDNNLFELSAKAQVNDFYEETEQLPAFDHYLIGGSPFANLLTWSAHNHLSYTKLNVADPPEDPAEAAAQTTLPGEYNRAGIIARTRQEVALPIQTGPVKIVPYLSGEAAHYGEAVDGDPLTRLLGQGGVRASLPMSRVDPTIESSLLNLRGLAHKLDWTVDYFYADSNANFEELPLYDPLDDHAQQQFRRRFIVSDYGGTLPERFDPRTYALRQGTQKYVTSGSDVIADDLQQVRLGLNQRFQTKRGLPGRERIVDVFQFDTDVLLFPEADRDNFGETVGPATYDMAYHIGDRVSLLSDGYFDLFDSGLRSMSLGVRSSRPGVGDIYLGLLSLEGPVSSTVFRSTVDMRLNEKWIWSSGTMYDFGDAGNIGQSFALTRIGESLLIRMGINVDSGRDNVGFGFTIEPRFWPSPRLGQIGGQLIPPPGVEGLE